MLNSLSIFLIAFTEAATLPLVLAYSYGFSLRFPLFSGQIWSLPNLGLVKIVEISEKDNSVWYILYPFDDLGEIHKSSRRDFTLHCRQPKASQEELEEAKNIVPFPNSEE